MRLTNTLGPGELGMLGRRHASKIPVQQSFITWINTCVFDTCKHLGVIIPASDPDVERL